MIPERIIFVSRGITVSLHSGQHPERIKRFSIETYGKSRFAQRRFRLTNVIPERIIFVSRGITVYLIAPCIRFSCVALDPANQVVTLCTTRPIIKNYTFSMDLRTKSDYFPTQHWLTGLYNRDGVCLLRGKDWACKCDWGQFPWCRKCCYCHCQYLSWGTHVILRTARLSNAPCRMLCNSNDTSYNVCRNRENGLFYNIHSIISYEIIFGGNQPYSGKIFKIQKKGD